MVEETFFFTCLSWHVNAYILYCETRNENCRNNCHLAFFLQKVGEEFAEKCATLAQNNVSLAADFWEGILLMEYPLLARKHIL